MHMDGPWQIVNIRANAKFDFDIAPIPAGWRGEHRLGCRLGVRDLEGDREAGRRLQGHLGHHRRGGAQEPHRAGRGYPARQSAVPIFEAEKPPAHAAIVQKVLNSEIGETRPFRSTATWQETDVMLTQDLIPAIFLGNPDLDAGRARRSSRSSTPCSTRAKDIESRG